MREHSDSRGSVTCRSSQALVAMGLTVWASQQVAVQVSAKVNAKVPRDPRRILKVGIQEIMAVLKFEKDTA